MVSMRFKGVYLGEKEGRTDGETDRPRDRGKDGWREGRTYGRTDGWMEGEKGQKGGREGRRDGGYDDDFKVPGISVACTHKIIAPKVSLQPLLAHLQSCYGNNDAGDLYARRGPYAPGHAQTIFLLQGQGAHVLLRHVVAASLCTLSVWIHGVSMVPSSVEYDG